MALLGTRGAAAANFLCWEFSMYRPEIKSGVIVRHPKFGVGKIAARYGEDEISKVIVKFQEEGEKKLALQYSGLEVDQPEEEAVAEGAEEES